MLSAIEHVCPAFEAPLMNFHQTAASGSSAAHPGEYGRRDRCTHIVSDRIACVCHAAKKEMFAETYKYDGPIPQLFAITNKYSTAVKTVRRRE